MSILNGNIVDQELGGEIIAAVDDKIDNSEKISAALSSSSERDRYDFDVRIELCEFLLG